MNYIEIETLLKQSRSRWLVTGCAGFIGSHLCERLLSLDQEVVGIDNLSTGLESNVTLLRNLSSNFSFCEVDITDLEKLKECIGNVDYILHQAAIGSVPRSISDPITSHRSNVDGTCNLLVFANQKKVKKLVYASSSSVYGDDSSDFKIEEKTGNLLSPYALTKKTNELYADVFARTYELKCVGLRYFNVFGPRQNPNGPYAAVIPKWIDSLKSKEGISINGDGSTARDFCYIENVVQANIISAVNEQEFAHDIFNVALGGKTTLNDLAKKLIAISGLDKDQIEIRYNPFRKGDIYISCANISKIEKTFNYIPAVKIDEGLRLTYESFSSTGKDV